MKKKVSYNVIDTTVFPSYEDYVENCELFDCDPDDEDSQDYWDYASKVNDADYNEDMRAIEYSEDNEHRCVITGSLGLWNGRPAIKPVVCGSLVKAIKKCFGSCDDLRVNFEDGVYKVSAIHHDGTNSFEIHKLSKKGNSVAEKWDNGEVLDEVKPHWFAKFKGVY